MRRPPPCVGCRQDHDRLGVVDAGAVTPSGDESIIGPLPGVDAVEIDGHLVVVDITSGRRVLLNASAALIYTAIDPDTRVGDLVDRIAAELGGAPEMIRGDVIDTVDRLVGQDLVTRDDLADATADPPPADTPEAASAAETVEAAGLADVAFDSGPRCAAGMTIRVRVADPITDQLLERALAAIPPAPATATAHPVDIGATDHDGRSPGAAVTRVFDRLDDTLTGSAPGLRFHAGAVERAGQAVIILGPSGLGKSTITAALVRAGWSYLTDELVAVDPTTGWAAAYPRPVDLDGASLDVLGIDRPDIVTGRRKDKVFPATLGAVSAGGTVGLVVVLSDRTAADDSDAPAEMLPPAEGLMAMLSSTFAPSFDVPDALEHLAELCRHAPIIRLRRAPLPAMVKAIKTAAADAGTYHGVVDTEP